MVFSEQTYSVLVVSSAQKFNETLTAMLPGTDYHPVNFVTNVAAARREMLAKSYDLVIVNAPLPDDFGTRFAIDASSNAQTVVLLLVRSDVYEQTYGKVTAQGVFTLSKPTSAQTLQQAIRGLSAGRERLRRLEKKATSIEEKMEEIRLLNRAKWLLIERRGMTEADAHRYIEKQAMDHCVSRREISMDIIRSYN